MTYKVRTPILATPPFVHAHSKRPFKQSVTVRARRIVTERAVCVGKRKLKSEPFPEVFPFEPNYKNGSPPHSVCPMSCCSLSMALPSK